MDDLLDGMDGVIDNTIMSDYLEAEFGEDSEDSDDDDRFRYQQGEWHSSNTYGCMRKWWYKFKLGSRSDPSSYPYFKLGHTYEKILGEALANRYSEDRVEQSHIIDPIPIEGSGEMVGEADFVIWDQDKENIIKGVEAKTTGNIKYKRGEPSTSHLYQVHPYMYATGLDQWNIIYMQRDDLETVVHKVNFDDEIWSSIVNRCKTFDYYLDVDKIPDADPDSEFQCKYCDFRKECKQEGGTRWQ